eukprot:SAG31_NODE_4685_length_3032_cov_15.682237_2_plen_302_part_00
MVLITHFMYSADRVLPTQALTEAKRHVPYQQSALTQLLREAFGGRYHQTTLLLTCPVGPQTTTTMLADAIATLRFGRQAKLVTNLPRRTSLVNSAAVETTWQPSHRMITSDPLSKQLRAVHQEVALRQRQWENKRDAGLRIIQKLRKENQSLLEKAANENDKTAALLETARARAITAEANAVAAEAKADVAAARVASAEARAAEAECQAALALARAHAAETSSNTQLSDDRITDVLSTEKTPACSLPGEENDATGAVNASTELEETRQALFKAEKKRVETERYNCLECDLLLNSPESQPLL